LSWRSCSDPVSQTRCLTWVTQVYELNTTPRVYFFAVVRTMTTCRCGDEFDRTDSVGHEDGIKSDHIADPVEGGGSRRPLQEIRE